MPRSSAAARPLTDHDEIRQWAEDRGARPRKPRAASDLPARLNAHRGSRALQVRGRVPAGAHRLVARSAAEPSQAAVVSRAERQPSRLRKNSGLEPIWEEHQFAGAGKPFTFVIPNRFSDEESASASFPAAC